MWIVLYGTRKTKSAIRRIIYPIAVQSNSYKAIGIVERRFDNSLQLYQCYLYFENSDIRHQHVRSLYVRKPMNHSGGKEMSMCVRARELIGFL